MYGYLQNMLMVTGILSNRYAFRGPLFAMFDITRNCNLRCAICPYHSKPHKKYTDSRTYENKNRNADPLILQKVSKELRDLNTREIILMGEGEPFMHPKIMDIISSIKDVGLTCEIITNGTLISKEIAEELVELGVDRIKVSLLAASPKVYVDTHPSQNADTFYKILDSIRYLNHCKKMKSKDKPLIIIHNSICKLNYIEIEKMVKLAIDLGADKITFRELIAYKGKIETLALSEKETDETIKAFSLTLDIIRKAGLEHNVKDIILHYNNLSKGAGQLKIPCYMGWVKTRIKHDGTVRACNMCQSSIVGNVTRQSFKSIWKSKEYRKFRVLTKSPALRKKGPYSCNCTFCCHFDLNLRIHNLLQWKIPFSSKERRRHASQQVF